MQNFSKKAPTTDCNILYLADDLCQAIISNTWNDIEPLATDLTKIISNISLSSRYTPKTLIIDDSLSALENSELALIATQLVRNNFIPVGSGDDAVAFRFKGSSLVIRIGRFPKPYTHFIQTAQNTKNSHFPAFWGHKEKNGICITCMEFLSHPSKLDISFWEPANSAINYAYTIADERPVLDQTECNLEAQLLNAAHIIGNEAIQNNWALDMVIGNVMVRPNTGEIIFTDPWSPWGE